MQTLQLVANQLRSLSLGDLSGPAQSIVYWLTVYLPGDQLVGLNYLLHLTVTRLYWLEDLQNIHQWTRICVRELEYCPQASPWGRGGGHPGLCPFPSLSCFSRWCLGQVDRFSRKFCSVNLLWPVFCHHKCSEWSSPRPKFILDINPTATHYLGRRRRNWERWIKGHKLFPQLSHPV